jgi:AbrB family looped-hinge helix DNA binding protein
MLANVSNKGQITLPAATRRKLGIEPLSQVEILTRDDELVIRPVKRVTELAGILHAYARPDRPAWETVREETEAAIAEEVVHAGRTRRPRRGR